METIYDWFMSRPKLEGETAERDWTRINEYFNTGRPNIQGSDEASMEICRHYNGSGPNAFGGAKEWMSLKVEIGFPLDTTQETVQTLMHDIRMALNKAGYS